MRQLFKQVILPFVFCALSASTHADGEQDSRTAGFWLANRFSDRFGNIENRLGNIVVGQRTGAHYWIDFEISRISSAQRYSRVKA